MEITQEDLNRRGPPVLRLYMDGNGNVVEAKWTNGRPVKHPEDYFPGEDREIDKVGEVTTPNNCIWKVIGGRLR